jgi:hypothetical protein
VQFVPEGLIESCDKARSPAAPEPYQILKWSIVVEEVQVVSGEGQVPELYGVTLHETGRLMAYFFEA